MKTTVIKKVNWESTNGSKVEVEIKLTKEIKKETINADGHKVEIKGKIQNNKKITLKANGKEIVSLSNKNPQIVEEKFFPLDFVEEVKANGGYAHIANGVTINEEKYKLVIMLIEEAELELKK